MRITDVIGHASGHIYEAYDTGETWNGAPVLAFTAGTLALLVAARDGTDANGDGLAIRAGEPVDISEGEVRPLRTIAAEVDGDTLLLYVPEGYLWTEETPTPGIEWDDENHCITCGEHIADPHSPHCPAALAAALYGAARDHGAATADDLAGADSPVVSHRLLAAAAHLAADLTVKDSAGVLSLADWPQAAQFVAAAADASTEGTL